MIDSQTIFRIAQLSRLKVSEEEAKVYGEQLTKLLAYFEQISGVETKGIEPLITPSEMQNQWRADEVQVVTTTEEIVQNAPQKTGQLFTVPPVV